MRRQRSRREQSRGQTIPPAVPVPATASGVRSAPFFTDLFQGIAREHLCHLREGDRWRVTVQVTHNLCRCTAGMADQHQQHVDDDLTVHRNSIGRLTDAVCITLCLTRLSLALRNARVGVKIKIEPVDHISLDLLVADRVQQIEQRVQSVDLERIARIDNERLIASREAKVIDAERKLQMATIKLSLFMRTPEGLGSA